LKLKFPFKKPSVSFLLIIMRSNTWVDKHSTSLVCGAPWDNMAHGAHFPRNKVKPQNGSWILIIFRTY